MSVLGLTGVPFINVQNGCATGASTLTAVHAMLLGRQRGDRPPWSVRQARAGCVQSAALEWGLGSWYAETGLMLTTQFFALKTQRYLHEHGIPERTLAMVAACLPERMPTPQRPGAARRSPRKRSSLDAVNPPLPQYMFCSPGEGAVALVLVRGDRIPSLAPPVYLPSFAFRTRWFGSFEVFYPDPAETAPSPTVEARRRGVRAGRASDPPDVHVAQLQDTETGAEFIHLAETGLCEHGEQEGAPPAGATRIGGRLPVNTDGGCLAGGEPSGPRDCGSCMRSPGSCAARPATGRSQARARAGFTQVYGAPGISACTVLST